MTSPAPARFTLAKARPNGVLPVPASQAAQKQSTASDPPQMAPARLKVVIRRLPPGLTSTEFEEAMGTEWKVGGECVDWGTYKTGKISKE